MAVITVSKQHASGGVEMARDLARKLGYHYFDRAVIENVAAEMGITPGETAVLMGDSRGRMFEIGGRLSSLVLAGLGTVDRQEIVGGRVSQARFVDRMVEMIRMLAEKGDVVIVGWGGQAILREAPGVVRVRAVAERSRRVAQVMKQDRCSEVSAVSTLEREDKNSRRFVEHYWKLDWDDPCLYDVVVNLSSLTRPQAVELVADLARIKAPA